MMISVVIFQQAQGGMRLMRDIGGVHPGQEGVAEGVERFPGGFLGGSLAGALAQLAHQLYGEVIECMR